MIEFLKTIAEDLDSQNACVCKECIESVRKRIIDFILEKKDGAFAMKRQPFVKISREKKMKKKKKLVTFRLSDATMKVLRQIAKKNEMSQAEVVALAIEKLEANNGLE